jgi:hypothetical protein
MGGYYDDDYEPPDPDDWFPPDDEPTPSVEPQPDHFCECRPGQQLQHRWQHAPECLRWAPPMRGSGSTPQHRAAVMANVRAQIAEAKRRHQDEATAAARRAR